jgi:hypothetical protein
MRDEAFEEPRELRARRLELAAAVDAARALVQMLAFAHEHRE